MAKFKIEVDAECIGDSSCDSQGKEPTLECFEAGENGGACEQLCFNKIKEIK